jgi:hypothetical protein
MGNDHGNIMRASLLLMVFCAVFLTACVVQEPSVPPESRMPATPTAPTSSIDTKNPAALVVFQAIMQWQNVRDVGVAESIQQKIIDEYLASTRGCNITVLPNPGYVKSYVFRYLDHARQTGIAYSPEITCQPFTQLRRRRENQYGQLLISAGTPTAIVIDNQTVDARFKHTLLPVGEHRLSIQLRNGKTCQTVLQTQRGHLTQYLCNPSVDNT